MQPVPTAPTAAEDGGLSTHVLHMTRLHAKRPLLVELRVINGPFEGGCRLQSGAGAWLACNTSVTAAASSYSTPRRRSVTYVSRSRSSAPKAFLATAFLTLGRRRHVVLRCYTLEQHVIRGLGKGRLCMGMAHMVLHLIKNPEV